MILTKKEKKIWNDAVKETVKEIKKYDGIILDEDERNYMAGAIAEKVSYKIKEEK